MLLHAYDDSDRDGIGRIRCYRALCGPDGVAVVAARLVRNGTFPLTCEYCAALVWVQQLVKYRNDYLL